MFSKAFSLLELLLVIVIISVLLGLSIPIYRKYTIQVENNKALYDLKNLISAELAYFSQYLKFQAFNKTHIQSNGDIIKGDFVFKSLSKDVVAIAKVSANGAYMNLCVKSIKGNKIFCYESDKDRIFYKKSYISYELNESDCPNATANWDCSPPSWKPLN